MVIFFIFIIFLVKVSSHFGVLKTDDLIDNELQPSGINFGDKGKRKSTLKNFQPKLKEEYLIGKMDDFTSLGSENTINLEITQ